MKIRIFHRLIWVIQKFIYNLHYWNSRKIYNKYFKASLSEITIQFKTRDEVYRFMNYLFNFGLSQEVKAHRSYFSKESRGFGEDALHAMWWLLFKEFNPKSCLEIGVYRGQVISLWALLAKINYHEINIGEYFKGIKDEDERLVMLDLCKYIKNKLHERGLLYKYH